LGRHLEVINSVAQCDVRFAGGGIGRRRHEGIDLTKQHIALKRINFHRLFSGHSLDL
jgi:hypothetical protein